MKLSEMDYSQRQSERAAKTGDETSQIRVFRNLLRSGKYVGNIKALAVLGYEPAMVASGVEEDGDFREQLFIALNFCDLSDQELMAFALDCAKWAFPVFGDTPAVWGPSEEEAYAIDRGILSDQEQMAEYLREMESLIRRGDFSGSVFRRAWEDAEPIADVADYHWQVKVGDQPNNIYNPDPSYQFSPVYYAVWAVGSLGNAGYYAGGGSASGRTPYYAGGESDNIVLHGSIPMLHGLADSINNAAQARGNEDWVRERLINLLLRKIG